LSRPSLMKLNQLTLTEALEGLKVKKFSSVELTLACLDEIKRLNPKLNAFLTLNPDALKAAKAADLKIRSDGNAFKTQPLLGIPYALKDNFLTAGLKTTASSKVLDDYIPQYDATVYARLKTAGTVLLGKTNMDAWAHGSSTETSDYGTTRNPWNLNHTPGGSSGGSAAAVAADMCIFAIGSETAGSVRGPACWCGITGLKPTYGRVSRYGVIAMASSTDSPGPLTKTVADAARVYQVIAGPDPFDATTSGRPVNLNLGHLQGLSLKGRRLAVPKEYLVKEMDKATAKLIENALKKLEGLGAKIDQISLIDPHYSIGVYTLVQRSEVSSNLARYDGVRYGNDRSHFGHEAKNRVMLGSFALSAGYYDQYYNKAQKVRTLIIEEFKKTFRKYDLVIGPVTPGPALKVGASKDSPMFGEIVDMLMEPSSVAGLTGTSVPCGFVTGLPVGLQITGPQFAEGLVLAVSAAYQAATDWHLKKPVTDYA